MPAQGQRIMEKLGRGFVAVGGATGGGNLLSWRLYGTEQGTDVAFNVYKGTTKLNATPITTSTNYLDSAAGGTDYTLKAIIGGVEEATGTKALSLPQGYLEIPIKDAGGRKIHLAYVGDLDGDGEYEYIVDRFQAGVSQYVDAYHRNGTFMWRVDMGPNSTNTDLSLSGPDTISCGHADDETVYDIDSDGKAELILRGANGMIFGDGKVLSASTTQTDQFIVAVDGVTGAEKGKECAVPSDLLSVGNSTGHFSIAYWDGVHPSLYYKAKAGGTAAMMDLGYDFKDNAWSLRFKAVRTPINSYPNNHNLRCVDLDRDGIDECVNGGYAIKGDGSIFWNMGSQGVSHGDRWHIGAMDPNPSADLLGWAIGQRSGYDWVEYNAKTGTVLRKVGAGTTDLARGVCGDVDPGQKGYECWTGGSVYNMLNLTGSPIGSGAPAQNFRIFWDGDVLAEVLDSNTVSKWAYPGAPSGGFTSANLAGLVPTRNAAPLYGDMFGDWREEVLFEQSGSTSIRIYSTAIPTDKRIYTLVHDPEYRNSMCEKGYQQSHMLDYYLGDGMADPPKPNIKYPDGSGAAGAGGGGTTGAAGASGGATSASAGASGGATSASAGASGSGATVLGGATGGGGTSEAGGASGGGATSASAGASSGGATSASAGASGGGALATSGAGVGGSGGTSGTGGIPAQGGGGAGTIAMGGTSAPGGTPGTGGGVGGNPVTGGSTSVVAGGAGAPAAGTTAVAGTLASASSAAGGTVAGQSSTGPKSVVAGSGCSCGIGGTSGRASAGSLFAMLGLLGLIAHRRHRRVSLRK
jgi:MYXO-CTERM domain-containing protein